MALSFLLVLFFCSLDYNNDSMLAIYYILFSWPSGRLARGRQPAGTPGCMGDTRCWCTWQNYGLLFMPWWKAIKNNFRSESLFLHHNWLRLLGLLPLSYNNRDIIWSIHVFYHIEENFSPETFKKFKKKKSNLTNIFIYQF